MLNEIESSTVNEESKNMAVNLSDENEADEHPDSELPSETPHVERKISGFWRRLLAIMIDMFILGLLGLLLGEIFFDTFSQMGSQGFWVGLIIAVFYFGWMNSSRRNGQTLHWLSG